MQQSDHRRSRSSLHRRWSWAALALLVCALTGCLVPIPLEQQNTSDGGQPLRVVGALPAFGTTRAMGMLDTYMYQVDLLTDSPNVVGRLYFQLNGTCCELAVNNTNITRYVQQSSELHAVDPPGSGRYTLSFSQKVLPCAQGISGPVYVVPVIAADGFVDDASGGINPEGRGETDRSHYWTVICPTGG